MDIRGDTHAYVQLVPCKQDRETSFPANLDVCLQVRVAAGEFRGGAPEVWFHKSDVERFLSDLEQLNSRLAGSAVLRSMSPDTFVLEFSAVGLARHLVVIAHLKQPDFLGDLQFDQAVSIGFSVEPTILSRTAEEFRTLLQLWAS